MKKMAAFGEHNAPYQAVFGDVSKIIDVARDSAARSVNAAMTRGVLVDRTSHPSSSSNRGRSGPSTEPR